MNTMTMPPALRDPTASAAIRNTEPKPPQRRSGRNVVYDPQVRVRRGSEPLQVTLAQMVMAPLRWDAGRENH